METQPNLLVIGDIHGSITKLKQAVEPYLGSGRELIFLGDLVDRAPDPDGDIQVLDYIRDIQDNAEVHGLAAVTVLLGNHEQYLINLKTKYKDDKYRLWEHNGGDPEFFAKADPYPPWIDTFEKYTVRGRYLFVHAGVRPGVRLKKQRMTDLMWIREDFLESDDHGLPFTVVHGHSVVGFTDLNPVPVGRINLDYGACFGGPLMALEIDVDQHEHQHVHNGRPIEADFAKDLILATAI